jgi:hypothetical protein
MLIATLGYAIGPLIIQRHLGGLDPFGPLAASLLVASLVLLVPAVLAFPTHLPSAVTLASMAILGVVCTAVAMLLMFYLVGHAGASRAAVITYINPAVAALLGVWLLARASGMGRHSRLRADFTRLVAGDAGRAHAAPRPCGSGLGSRHFLPPHHVGFAQRLVDDPSAVGKGREIRGVTGGKVPRFVRRPPRRWRGRR